MSILRKILSRFRDINNTLHGIDSTLDDLKINQGKILVELNRRKTCTSIRDYEFKVFSQWGEDGIIQRLIECVEIKNKTFIEFGVQDFFESNCRFLMTNNDWSGFVIDGSAQNIQRLRAAYFYHQHQLEAIAAFVTRENINELLRRSGFDRDLGLLSVDIDGVDYFIVDAIVDYNPRILILEYNAVFGDCRKISVPYSADFCRTNAHFSNLYYGASLPAMMHLANRRGYTFVGTTSSGGNAFFVRNDLVSGKLERHTGDGGFVASSSRESRDKAGFLTLVGGAARLEVIKGLPVVNVESGQTEFL